MSATLVILVLLVVCGLSFAIWQLAKAGGGVDVGFNVNVRWGGK
jgi:hypothetical protein